MAVEVRLPNGLTPFTGGRRTVTVTGATLAEVVAALETPCPGVAGHLADSGELRPNVLCAVDGELTRDLRTAVADGGTVEFLPAVSGG